MNNTRLADTPARRCTAVTGPLMAVMVLLFAVNSSNSADRHATAMSRILKLVDKGAVVLCDEQGKPLISHNPDKLLVPASIVKIVTAQGALDVLGEDYRFKTEFFVDSGNTLSIKGWGDPYLISEEIDTIAKRLRAKGLANIRELQLDRSAFVPAITIPGVSKTLNPYDAINGALAVNFNTINVRRDARGTVYSGEPATPLTPLARTKAAAISPGAGGRINLTRDESECLQYAGELFGALLCTTDVAIRVGEINPRKNRRWRLIHTHENTRDLSVVVKGLMKYSNNFIANQLFLTVGATKLGYPATLEKGVKFYREYMTNELGLTPGKVTLVEGSGISRENRINATTMIKVLEKFNERAELLPAKGTALVKSGTLNGVYNYAGYIKTSKGLRPFVIMLNQPQNTRDSILKLLTEYGET
ncbi:MAG: hypothetical protein GF344_09610 [Chitinivibrionales bacterium]|nr:hypothetical protein [Chitinivibrionales bacterium]MBD3357098.1 hypothetical protein [Chitinivibrionales bacterium]